MKNMVRIVLLVVVFSIGLGALCACGSGKNLKGTWELTDGNHKTVYMKLYDDGTGEFSSSKDGTGAEKGNWTVTEDGMLKITGSIGGQFFFLGTISGTYELDGKTLTIEDEKRGTLVYTKVAG